jgi:hypothetical protein
MGIYSVYKFLLTIKLLYLLRFSNYLFALKVPKMNYSPTITLLYSYYNVTITLEQRYYSVHIFSLFSD